MPDGSAIHDAITSSVAAATEAGVIDATPDVVASEPVNEPVTPAADTGITAADAAVTPATEPVKEPDQPAISEEDDLANIEKGLVEANPSLRQGTISRSRHQAMLTRRGNEHKAALDKALIERETAIRGEYGNMAPDVAKDRLLAFEVAETNPGAFVDKILMQDQRYVDIFNARVDAEIAKRGLVARGSDTPAPSATAAPTERPKPDALLPDGSLGYTAETLEKVLAFELDQKAAALEKKFEERFGALDKDLKPARDVREHNERIDAAKDRMRPVYEDAKANWPGFMENHDEIFAELRKPGNERITLATAYNRVVHGKNKTALEEANKRAEQAERDARVKITKEMTENAGRVGRTLTPGKLPSPAGENETSHNPDDRIRSTIAQAAASLR